MSIVKFEQQTLAVFTELTDEEINGIVGGGKQDTKVAIGVKAPTNVKGTNVQTIAQVGIAIAKGEKASASVGQKAEQNIYESKGRRW